MPTSAFLRRSGLVAATVTTMALLLSAACGGGGDSDTVTVQLDWTPNTNHIGIYLAQAKGYYKEAGVKVKVLPYGETTNPDTIVANGKADIGVSFPANVIFSRAAGLDIVSIASVLQHNVTELAVLDSSDIRTPKDFDGKTYAGFGLPYEEPQLQTVIKAAGGTGNFKTATLSTAAYEALYNKRADFTEIFTAWEGIEAQLRGIKLRTFKYADYDVPDYPSVVLIAKESNISKRSALYQRFLEATRRGYEYAAANPDAAAKEFIDFMPKGTFENPDLVTRSTAVLAPVYVAGDKHWGSQDGAQWDAYTHWLIGSGAVTDDKGKKVSDVSGPLFTNELLAGSR